jgi:hypothetical protein
MMSDERTAAREQAITLIQGAFAKAAHHGDLLVPSMEAQVHRAIDLLRTSQADDALLGTAQFVSCGLMQMRHYRRQGRVNAYASKLMRVRKACASLS